MAASEKIHMETVEAYLERKHQELRLLNCCLTSPLPLTCPRSVAEVIRHKFQLTAALRAEHTLHDWAITETAWAHSGRRRVDHSSSDTTTSALISRCAALLSTSSTVSLHTKRSILVPAWLRSQRCCLRPLMSWVRRTLWSCQAPTARRWS